MQWLAILGVEWRICMGFEIKGSLEVFVCEVGV